MPLKSGSSFISSISFVELGRMLTQEANLPNSSQLQQLSHPLLLPLAQVGRLQVEIEKPLQSKALKDGPVLLPTQ